MPKSKFAFYFDTTVILIIFMQIRYIKVFDLTNAFPRSLASSLNRGFNVHSSFLGFLLFEKSKENVNLVN